MVIQEGNLQMVNPVLAAEWHPTKNGTLRPTDVKPNSNKCVWWMLQYDDPDTGNHFDFEWEAIISDRNRGNGCPFLSGKAVYVGFNDLGTTHPTLAKEWNYYKNGELTPQMVTAGSRKKVWWVFPYDDPDTGKHYNFEWEATISDRIKGNGCPYLSGKAVHIGYNDLATTHPLLAKEWNYKKNKELSPQMVSAGSGKKVWWVYPYDDPNTGKHFDFEWEAIIANRVKQPACPFLSSQLVWRGYNDLATLRPDLVLEWHPTKNGSKHPYDVTPYSNKKVWWLIAFDDPDSGKHFEFEWEATPNARMREKEHSYLLKGINNYEKNSKEMNKPLEQLTTEEEREKERYFFETALRKRNVLCEGFNDLATVNPELASEWDSAKNGALKPNEILATSKRKVWWILPYDDPKTNKHFDFEWEASPYDRLKAVGNGCPYLLNRAVWPGFNDLQTLNPALSKEWHPRLNGEITPAMVTPGSMKKAWWILPYDDPETGKHFDFEWQAVISSRALKGIGCPFLSNNAVWPGFNDLATLNPTLALEWHPIKNDKLMPSDVSSTSGKKVWWICEKGHEWRAIICNRAKGVGCPICDSENKSSSYEYAILYYLKQVDPSVEHSNKEFGFELDIYIPSKKIGIEYDGAFWHKKKQINDKKKNKACKDHDITLFRFRENDLGCLNDSSIDITVNDETFEKELSKLVFLIYKVSIDVNLQRDQPRIDELREFTEKDKSLLSMAPSLAREWHPTKNGKLKPENVMPNSDRKVWWLLPYDDPITGKHYDFEWRASIANRYKGRRCPYLTNKSVFKGFNDLSTVKPSLAAEWHPSKNGKLTPKDVCVSSNNIVWWLLPYDDPDTGKHFDFEWKASVSSRTSGSGCPFLTGHKVWKGFNDLETLMPELAAQWHPTKNGSLRPSDVTAGSSENVWWLLPYDDPNTGKHFDFEWRAVVEKRASGIGCPYIMGRLVWKGYNDLATLRPDLAKEWHPYKNNELRACDVTIASGKKVWWLLPYDDPRTGKHYDFEWQAEIYNRTNGNSCPFLSNKEIWPGYNDFATLYPELIKYWNPHKNGYLTPQDVMPGSAKKVYWMNENGIEEYTSIRAFIKKHID